jgi:peptidoglycan/xylan/chitin deacetylase (PgdA/CDA1 family)
MREGGHDLLGHGWRWREPWTQSREEERADLLRAIETFERVLGERPLGWNSRSFPSEHTRELLVEEGGFLYDSDPSNDDLPYYATCLGRPVLIVPYTKTYQDARYLVSPGFASPRDYVDTLVMGLDELLADERPAMMTVVAHARWSGQAARAAAIRGFIEHALARDGVRFMRRLDIARWWLERFPPS